MEKMTAKQFRDTFAHKGAKAGAKTLKGQSANALTKTVLNYLNMQGFRAWRQNTVGILDPTELVKKLGAMFASCVAKRRIPTKKELQALIRSCYRKNNGLNGTSDIQGYQKKTGRFIAVEVKAGSDTLKPHQAAFLQEVKRNGGIAIVARDFDGFLDELGGYEC